MIKTSMKQCSELTHKYNRSTGRHGWLRLTPAYSVKLVETILEHYPPEAAVLDPFSGTGTTVLASASLGHESFGIDINPFLVWLGNVKTAGYPRSTVEQTRASADMVIRLITDKEIPSVEPPLIHNIERWWHKKELEFLCRLKGAIDHATDGMPAVRDVLYVVFARTVIEISNAAFNHQSMSFKNTAESLSDKDPQQVFRSNLDLILCSVEENPTGEARVVLGDARKVSDYVDRDFDLLVTSPPYPNRMSYIRELRPYMYWLGYLHKAKEAGELDWQAIGGTWGCATSKLNSWQADRGSYSWSLLEPIAERVSHDDNKNGSVLATYILKYFEDIEAHLKDVKRVMKKGGTIAYIVGNSTFYGVLLPVEAIYAQLMEHVGFRNVGTRVIRKRNSKKELYEFLVTADRP